MLCDAIRARSRWAASVVAAASRQLVRSAAWSMPFAEPLGGAAAGASCSPATPADSSGFTSEGIYVAMVSGELAAKWSQTIDRLDDIAAAFAWVIDAKSPFTFHHSER